MDLGIAGQVAVVTGGARGIGEAISIQLAGEGARIAIWDRDEAGAAAVCARIGAAGGEAIAVGVDVTSRADVKRAAEDTRKRLGDVAILVNNAGFSVDAPLLTMTDEEWDSAIDTNLRGVFLVTQAIAPMMVANGYGRICNIASRSHLGGEPNKANYSAAKGGVVSFTRAVAKELGRHAITVNAVAPGLVLTDRLLALPHQAEIRERAREGRLVDMEGTPRDIANSVLHVVSAHSGYLTGEIIHVTGGRF